MLSTMNTAIQSARAFISPSSTTITSPPPSPTSTSTPSSPPSSRSVVVFVTLGTARVHKLRPHGIVVANCHKREKCEFFFSFYACIHYICTVCTYVLYIYVYPKNRPLNSRPLCCRLKMLSALYEKPSWLARALIMIYRYVCMMII